MASLSVTVSPGTFPEGTEVGAYTNQPVGVRGRPIGAPADVAVVAAGELAFTDLADDQAYALIAQVGGEYPRLNVSTERPQPPYLNSVEIATASNLNAEASARADADASLASDVADIVVDTAAVGLIREAPLNVKDPDFGAVGDNNTDDAAAIQAAIDALPQSGSFKGGEIYFPPGIYKFGTALDLAETYGVTLRGAGSTGSGYTKQGSVLQYTGTGSRGIDGRSTYGLTLKNLGVEYTSSSFTGNLVDLQHSAAAYDTSYFLAEDCTMNGLYPKNGAASLISFKEAILCEVRGGAYSWAQTAFRFREDVGGGNTRYSNGHRIGGATFQNVKNALMNAGEQLKVSSCYFEGTNQDSAGMIRAYYDDIPTGSICYAVSFHGCWMGDAVLVTNWIDFGNTAVDGLDVSGCAFLGGTKGIKFTKGGKGISVHGNSFGLTNAVDLGSSGTGICTGVAINGNDFSSVTGEPVLNTSGHRNFFILGNSARNSENNGKDLVTFGGHIQTDEARNLNPTVSAVSGAGSGATVSIAGNDTAGTITVNTGTSATTGGLVDVTFAEAFDSAATGDNPRPKILLTPRDAVSAGSSAYVSTGSQYVSFRVNAAVAPTSSTTARWDYFVIA